METVGPPAGTPVRAGGRRAARALLPALAIVALAAAAYAPFLVAPYAYSDDYTSLWTIGGPGLGAVPVMVLRGGRIVYALVYDLVFEACRGVADLRWVRGIAAAGAAAAGIAAGHALRRRGAAPAEAWIAGAGVALLPAMAVPVAWASAFVFPWASAGGLLAGTLWGSAWARGLAGDRRGAAARGAAALLALLVLLHVYQPAAQFWFVPAAAAIALAPAGRLHDAVREAGAATALFVVAGALHLAIFHAYVRHFEGGAPIDRAELVALADLPAHLRWYLGEALPNALRIFVVDRWLAPALLVAAIAAAGLALRFRRRGGPVALGLAACAALLPISYAANLVTAQRWPALRTMGASASIAWVLLLVAGLELAARWGRRGRRAVLALAATIVLAQAVQIRERLAPLMVDVQLDEMAMVRARVAALVASGERWVVFRRAHWSDAGVAPLVHDEFGTPSSAAEWVPRAMVQLFHRELTGRDYPGHVTVIGPDDPLREGAFTIDMRAEYEQLRHRLRLPGAARPKSARALPADG